MWWMPKDPDGFVLVLAIVDALPTIGLACAGCLAGLLIGRRMAARQ